MTDKPILFSGDMVRALLAGSKTQTRRVITKQAAHDALATFGPEFLHLPGNRDLLPINVVPGDRLWVRETHALTNKHAYRLSVGVDQRVNPANDYDAAVYRACFDRSTGGLRWRPSIHMPRWASRLTLTVTGIQVERLQEICREDAVAEGCPGFVSKNGEDGEAPEEAFRTLWDSLNKDRGFGWTANPWVVAYTFTVSSQNIDAAQAA